MYIYIIQPSQVESLGMETSVLLLKNQYNNYPYSLQFSVQP